MTLRLEFSLETFAARALRQPAAPRGCGFGAIAGNYQAKVLSLARLPESRRSRPRELGSVKQWRGWH
ncbi:MAG: hypothetical protein ACK53L_25065, partial [Pirellulaceae bacterium]